MFQTRSLRRQTGAFDLIKIEKQTSTEVVALLNGRDSDKVGRIVLEVEPAEPHRILKLEGRAIPRLPDLVLPHFNESELIASLRQRLNEARSEDTFSGTRFARQEWQAHFLRRHMAWPTESTIFPTHSTLASVWDR